MKIMEYHAMTTNGSKMKLEKQPRDFHTNRIVITVRCGGEGGVGGFGLSVPKDMTFADLKLAIYHQNIKNDTDYPYVNEENIGQCMLIDKINTKTKSRSYYDVDTEKVSKHFKTGEIMEISIVSKKILKKWIKEKEEIVQRDTARKVFNELMKPMKE